MNVAVRTGEHTQQKQILSVGDDTCNTTSIIIIIIIIIIITIITTTATICGDACPLSCTSAEAYKLAQCTRPQGWGS